MARDRGGSGERARGFQEKSSFERLVVVRPPNTYSTFLASVSECPLRADGPPFVGTLAQKLVSAGGR